MNAHDIIATSALPAYTTDAQQRILDVNRAAEMILGLKARDVRGKACFEVFVGEDLYGNMFCQRHCSIMTMTERGERVSPCEMRVRQASGGMLKVRVDVLALSDPVDGHPTIAHLIQPVLGNGARKIPSPGRIPGNGAHSTGSMMTPSKSIGGRALMLTDREIEVLRLLTQGVNCRDISTTLSISVATTRNHIRHILKKLDVHSQAEAISFTLRNGLL